MSRNVTSRQAVLLAGAAALCAATAGSALTGHFGVALSVLALFLAAVLAGLLLVGRRLGALQAAHRRSQADARAVLDQTQRRVLAAVEEMLLKAGDRHRELTDAVAAQRRATGRVPEQLRAQTREVEALVQLFQGFTPRAPMPPSGDFALNPTDLLDLVHLIRTRRPRLVLELGSGTSTVWIAYLLEQSGGRLVSLDHDPAYAAKTRAALAAHGLSGVAEVREAPLRPVVLDGRTFPWYDTGAVADLDDVELLVIDGPPGSTGPDARYPAMRVLEQRLADTATVVVDDAHRPDEQLAVRRWLEAIEGLTLEDEALGRHAVLAYRRAAGRLLTQ